MIIGLVHVIIVTITVMFIVYLIVCTVRSLRVTVAINKDFESGKFTNRIATWQELANG